MFLLAQAALDPWFYFMVAVVFSCSYFSIRKYVPTILDPIFFSLFWFSFSVAVVFYLFLNEHIRPFYFYSFFYMMTLFVTAIVITKNFLVRYAVKTGRNGPAVFTGNINVLTITTFLFCVLIVLSLVYRWSTTGLAIFSDNPLNDRVEISQQSRLVDAVQYCSVFAIAGCTLIFFLARTSLLRAASVSMLGVLFFASFTAGSKGAVIQFLTSVGIGAIFLVNLDRGRECKKFISVLAFLILPVGVLYAIALLMKMGAQRPVFDIFIRFVSYGDVYAYYFVQDLYDDLKFKYDFFAYITHVITNRFGISPIQHSIGAELFGRTTGNYGGFGPNPQFVTEGMIMFGIPLAGIYAIVIGIGCAIVRFVPQLILKNINTLTFFLGVVCLSNLDALPVDLTLFQARALSMLVFFFPVYFLAVMCASVLESFSVSPVS